jgi:hypothetical protein
VLRKHKSRSHPAFDEALSSVARRCGSREPPLLPNDVDRNLFALRLRLHGLGLLDLHNPVGVGLTFGSRIVLVDVGAVNLAVISGTAVIAPAAVEIWLKETLAFWSAS